MCGICGELRFDGELPNLTRLTGMMDNLARRGPDDAGYYQEKQIALGHRRLAIIDLSSRAHQPMHDDSLGLTLVFNGTIYNYRQLRQELQKLGHIFQSDGDTEVILKSYAAWGEKCVTQLHGMFAFALWDSAKQQLLLARDRLGIKPLYYTKTKNYLRFASTLPALLKTGEIDKTLDPVALHHHLTLHAVVPAPRTIFQAIRKVSPATTLTISSEGQVAESHYWQLTACRPAQELSENQWIEATRERLKTTVDSHRLAADVPVGVLLSGGLDSSLLVGLLAQQQPENLLTFSIGFDDAPQEKGSEFEYSDQVIARYPTCHHRYHIKNSEVLTRLPEAIAAMSEPMVAQDAVAFYLLAEQVSQQAKVVQSGQGADEVFAGYFWYPLMHAATGSISERFSSYYFDRSHQEFLATVTPDFHGEDYTTDLITNLLTRAHADTFLDQVLRMDVTMLIVDDPVKRVDNMTMAWGLEARVPFLDHQLVEFAAMMPPELKLRTGGKYPLKAVARDILPHSVIDRPKGYFPVPALKYVRGEFLTFMQTVLNSTACRQRHLFQRDYVEKLLAAPEQFMTPLKGSKLWHLALLESWLQQFD